ncbi:hypothetical protein Solca_2769 [Solitalea canadensis DSM 3403]|uniref:Uncharacterized protein n=1 Tax=Solitalea canadensis (strain ATCC 29591 / DSM 3403 / JCM 21819 / LMG 8368 / NBRC 15130 / NCIMB 12057 / USAM 9D) TaxID=929556 RepID=H8KS08_SOLCM|nr:hypothetical protein Solca_2769 [Solitalea canadensis DSM 3403]
MFDRLLSLVKKDGYEVVYLSGNQLFFENNVWKFGSRIKAFGKIDKGEFEILDLNNGVTLRFVYYIDTLVEVVLIPTFILCGFTLDYFIFIFAFILIIQLFIRISVLRTNSKKIFENIIN